MNKNTITDSLKSAIKLASEETGGKRATYIPELATVPEELINMAVMLPDGTTYQSGNELTYPLTLQSAAKVVLLIALLEELGPEKVYSWVRVEPSGSDFASLARLDQFGPLPSNPMMNSGAITLCCRIPGNTEDRLHWLEGWMEKCFGEKLSVNHKVFQSEQRAGDRNRAIAYLLKSTTIISGNVDEILDTYFSLCSFEATITQAAYLPMLLANGGLAPDQTRVFSQQTADQVLSILATCGLYNETGSHMLRTGLPAKSSVSGFILAVAPGKAGIAVASPRVNKKGTSLRGEIMLEHLSKEMGWHFAS